MGADGGVSSESDNISIISLGLGFDVDVDVDVDAGLGLVGDIAVDVDIGAGGLRLTLAPASYMDTIRDTTDELFFGADGDVTVCLDVEDDAS